MKTNVLEALRPSEWRPFKEHIKGWNRDRYKDLFMSGEWETNRNATRIYLPLETEQVHAPKPIEKALKKAGYKVHDYRKGLAQSIQDPNRKMKIGKLLAKYPNLVKKMQNDPRRQGKSDYEIVISRHPYDLLGMSTNRGWESCMNLSRGEAQRYIPMDIKHGTIIAYGIKKGKTPEEIRNQRNLKEPVCRVLIKPFINIEDENDIILGIENAVYGTSPPGFERAVMEWVDDIEQTDTLEKTIVVKAAKGLYSDNPNRDPMKIIVANADEPNYYEAQQIEKVKYEHLASNIKDMPDASDLVWAYAINAKPSVIQYHPSPSELLQLITISAIPYFIEYIKNPTDKVQVKAVQEDTYAISVIENPCEEAQMIAIRESLSFIQLIKNPTEKVQLLVVERAPQLIKHIMNPTERVQLAAVKKDFRVFDHIKNPADSVLNLLRS